MIAGPTFFSVVTASGDPSYSSRKLILPLDTNLTDYSASPATITSNNSAAISTTRSKFGTGSLFLNGTNQYLTTNRTAGVGTGMFTLEAHIRPTGAQTGRVISQQDQASSNAVFILRVDSTGSITGGLRDSAGAGLVLLTSATGLINMADTTWYHIAMTRNSSNLMSLWIDGTSVASGTATASPNGPANYNIGSQFGTGEFFKGYLGNVRISEGVCQYTGTFTPPAAPYPTS